MTVETAIYVSQLDEQNPKSFDMLKEGDDHIRLIKGATKTTFPRFDAKVDFSADQLNRLYKYTFASEDNKDAGSTNTAIKNFNVISKATFQDNIEFALDTDDTYKGEISGLADIQFTTEETNDPDTIDDEKKSRAMNLGTADARYIKSADEEGLQGAITQLVWKEDADADPVVVAKTSKETLTVTNTIVTNKLTINEELDCKELLKSKNIELSADLKVTGSIFRGSDRRLKKDIRPLEVSLDEVFPVSYVKNDKVEYGVIAQELPFEYLNIINEDSEGMLSVDYTQFIPVLIKEIQNLKAEITKLKGE